MSSLTTLNANELKSLIPPPPKGWIVETEAQFYTPETLYDYINGGAELFLSYGMNRVVSEIVAMNENEIRVEIFDMIHPENAFGVFSHTRTKNDHQYGQGSQLFPGTLIFWKDKFYITLTANDVNKEISNALSYYAEQIDKAIEDEGSKPEIVNLIPDKEEVGDDFLYFHHYIWQNAYHFLANENLLNISFETPAVLAKYGSKNERFYLLLVQYNSEEESRIAYATFNEHFFGEFGEKEIYNLEDNTWWLADVHKNYFIAVLNAPSEKQAKALYNSTIKQTMELKKE